MLKIIIIKFKLYFQITRYFFNRINSLPYGERFGRFITDISNVYACHPELGGKLIALEKINAQKIEESLKKQRTDAFAPIESDEEDYGSDEENVYDIGGGIILDRSFDKEYDQDFNDQDDGKT